jgi:D-alanyl-D-alanine carboxypeptidase
MRKGFIVLILIGLLGLGGYLVLRPGSKAHAPTQSKNGVSFNKKQYSLSDPDSLWVIVNKRRPLTDGYAPADLMVPNVKLRLSSGADEMHMRREAGVALEQLVAGAKQQSFDLMLVSGYRSQVTQTQVYNSYVKQSGQAMADRESARPRHSEHQTGWAADLGRTDRKCELETCFGTTAEGEWLAAHAYEYGFVLRYAQDTESITGYQYEPWHFRYVGKTLAAEAHKTGSKTLEDFFNLSAAPSY